MSQVTSHILDITNGKPAGGVIIIFYRGGNDQWTEITRCKTDTDGRAKELQTGNNLVEGIYKLRFETKDYFDRLHTKTFYPYVEIIFEINSPDHYHVPLLLSAFGYSTYRGS